MIRSELRAEAAASPRILIVGEDPGRGDPALPLYPLPAGCTGARLRELTGMSRVEYLARTDRLDLFRTADSRPSDKFWQRMGCERALDLAPLLPWRVIVALGRRVTAALLALDESLDVSDPALLPWYEPIPVTLPIAQGPRCVVIPHPHPSARSTVWKTEAAHGAARIFWQRLLTTDLGEVARQLVRDQIAGKRDIPVIGPPAVDHELKTWPAYLDEVWQGHKILDLRPDDRGFEAGQVLRLRDWHPGPGTWGGRSVFVRVTHVLRDIPHFGLAPGYCALSIRVLHRESRDTTCPRCRIGPAGNCGQDCQAASGLDQVATSRI